MEPSSVIRTSLTRADFRTWAWWKLPLPVRVYVAAVVGGAVGLAFAAAFLGTWRLQDLPKFVLLLACGMISVAATPRVVYMSGGLTRDFLTVWVLPVAVLLPPIYAMLTPIPLYVLTQMRVHKGVVYRKVFTVAAIGGCYGAGSFVFHAFPSGFAGPTIGSGMHAVTWTIAVGAAELVGRRGHGALIMGAIKLSNPEFRVLKQELSRESIQADLAEFDLGVVVTVVVGVIPILAVVAVPTVLLVRRFMMHAQLLAKSRIDTKTGLLNASTWETEAAIEIARAVRTRTPIAIALIDIDHFKLVNDTHGHLAGDKVLKAMGEEIQGHLRQTDRAGRFGGEEFVVLLPNAGEADALRVADRLRQHIAATPFPIGDDPAELTKCVNLTISAGVAALSTDCRELTDLLAAADAALYHAKQTGRNRTHAPSTTHTPSTQSAERPKLATSASSE
jgi:diguanylate cyclase (GGDEF)-like protein